VPVQGLNLVFRQALDVDQPVTRPPHGGHDLVQFQVDRPGVLVLGALDEEYHQERDDRGAGV